MCPIIKKHSFPKNMWFDDECKAAKRRVNNAKKVFLQCVHAHTRAEYFYPKRFYRRLLRIKKVQAQHKLHTTLLTMRQTSPKKVWNLINRERRELHLNSHIQPEKLYFHFKSLHESKVHTSEANIYWRLGCPSWMRI